jgi:hypothetical protein
MGKSFQTPQSICVAVLRLKNDGGPQLFHQMGLTGDSEFCGKIAPHPGDDIDRNFHM